MGNPNIWTKERLATMHDDVLPNSTSLAQAVRKARELWGGGSHRDSFRNAFIAAYGAQPTTRLAQVDGKTDMAVKDLVNAVRRGGVSTLEQICNSMHLCPKDVRDLAKRAIDDGYSIKIEDDGKLHFAGLQPRGKATSITFPKVCHDLKFAICSDLHFGSKYHRGDELADFAKQAYKAGVRDVFVAGDMLDGTRMWEGQEFDLTHHGFDDQSDEMIRSLPSHKGMTWHFITGNHDGSFWKKSGMEPGRALTMKAKNRGRNDLNYLGAEDAVCYYGGASEGEGLCIELYHPKKAGSYARSYHLQNYIASMTPGTKPQILVSGHEHSYIAMYERNVWAIKPGTFQSQTPFMARLRLMPALGGAIVRVRCAEDWSIRSLNCEWVPYFGSVVPRGG
jgi:predicted phosphodiesterase